jgi:predicted nucleic acid-binding protein
LKLARAASLLGFSRAPAPVGVITGAMQCSRQPFVIDSNIFDKIADERGAASLVGRLVGRNAIELLVTHVQIDEIVATPDAARRKHLLSSAPYREVPTHGALYDASKYHKARYTSKPVERDIAAIQRRNKAKDALIGTTAKWDGATLVTEDDDFAQDATAQGVAVLKWPQSSPV